MNKYWKRFNESKKLKKERLQLKEESKKLPKLNPDDLTKNDLW